LRYDFDECLGPERGEWMQAMIASAIAQTHGADLDVYSYLALNPWNKIQRPMPSTEFLVKQIDRKTPNRGK